VVGGVGREEEVLVGRQLVDGLQEGQGELLLARVQAQSGRRVRGFVVVGGQTLLVGAAQKRHHQEYKGYLHDCCNKTVLEEERADTADSTDALTCSDNRESSCMTYNKTLSQIISELPVT
jgi:hypothetical protein